MMRVAILGPYPLDMRRLGGVEVAIAYVQAELLKLPDVELHIVTCKEELRNPQTTRQDRLSVTYLPRAPLGRVTWHLREVRAMGALLREIKPDIVHAHGTGLYAGAALDSPYPAVITVHGIMSQEARLLTDWRAKLRAFMDSQYEYAVVRRAQHLILITPYVEQVFAGIFKGKSYLVENACDERFFNLQRRPAPGRMLFVGMVTARKGVLPLLKALRLVRQQVPEAHLRIAGSTAVRPDYARECEVYIREAGLGDAVSFLGHLNQEQLLEEYARCIAFVLPSFQETAPMVIEQAMAAGVPSVATCAGGVPWMIEHGVTGWTLPVPPSQEGDPAALAGALLRVLKEPEGANVMGWRANQEAERRFKPGIVAQHTYAVYRQVIAGNKEAVERAPAAVHGRSE